MTTTTRGGGGNARRATIAFTVDVNVDHHQAHADEEDDCCSICRNTHCVAGSEDDSDCCRVVTTLQCCDQTLCCGCLSKMLLRCTCTTECTQVIAYCAFCRRVSPVATLDVFRGACCRECPACVKHRQKQQAVVAAAPPPEPPGPTDDDNDDNNDDDDDDACG